MITGLLLFITGLFLGIINPKTTESTYSYIQAQKKGGVFMPVGLGDVRLIFRTELNIQLYYEVVNNTIEKISPSAWKDEKFVKTDETFVISV